MSHVRQVGVDGRRVLWLSNETPDRFGQGGQRRQYFQIEAITAAGHHVTVVSLAGRQSDTSLRRIADVHRTDALIRGRIPNPMHFWRYRRVSGMTWDAVIVAHTESWPKWRRFVRGAATEHVLVDMHNVISPWHLSEGRTAEAEYWRAVEHEIANVGAYVAVCSAREMDLLPTIGRTPLVVGHGADPIEWSGGPVPVARRVVKLFGNWDWEPNRVGLRWFLSEVWPKLSHDLGITCEIAGSGVSDSLPSGVVALGRVPSINHFLSDALAVAVPVMRGVGAPLKLAEALASGAPVLATLDGAPTWQDLPLCVSDIPMDWINTLHGLVANDQVGRARALAARQTILDEGTWESQSQPLVRWVSSARPDHTPGALCG